MSVSSAPVSLNTWIYFSVFFNNSAPYTGSDIYGLLNYTVNPPSSTIFDSYSYTLTDQSNRVSFELQDSTSILHDDWLPYLTPILIYIRRTGGTDELCVNEEISGCESVSAGVDRGRYLSRDNEESGDDEEGRRELYIELLGDGEELIEGGEEKDGWSAINIGEDWLHLNSSLNGSGNGAVLSISGLPEDSSYMTLGGGGICLSNFSIVISRNIFGLRRFF